MSFNDLVSAIGPVLPDNTSTALEIEGVDSKDYLIVTTTDGSEAITIKGGGSAGLAVHENNQVRSTVADGWVFLSSDPTDTSPNICPSQKDLDTGIGHGAGGNTNSDQLSLIAGGVEGIRLTESGGAVTVAISGAVSHTGNLEIENASPTLTLDNSTSENASGGRESTIRWSGKKADGTAHYLAEIVGAQNGSSDNQSGVLTFAINTGSSGTSLPTFHYFDSSGCVGFNGQADSSHRLSLFGSDSNSALLIRNTASADGDDTGSATLHFQRKHGGGTTSSSAKIIASHDGTAQDDKGKLVFQTNAGSGVAERMRITNDGKITTNGEASALCKAGGIHLLTGTQTGVTANTDAQDLVIESNATELGITFAGGNSSRQRIQFADIASNAAAAIAFNHADNDMTFWSGNGFQKFYFLEEGYVQVNLATPTAMLAAEGNLITQGAGTIESISTATVTGSGTSFESVLKPGDAIKFTNDADGTEIRTVKSITSNTELVLTETPGATGAGRSTKTYFIDPTLFSLTTGDSVTKFISKNGRIGINTASPDYPLHVVGPGGTTGMTALTGVSAPTLFLDNSNLDSSDRTTLMMNTDGSNGSQLDMYQADTRRFLIQAQASSQNMDFAGKLSLRATAGTVRMGIDSDGPVWVGSSTTSLNSKEFEVNNGTQAFVVDIQGTTSSISILGNNNSTRQQMSVGSSQGHGLLVSKYGTAVMTSQLGEVAEWIDNQTNANRSAFLADSNTDLVLDWDVGQVGIIELVDNIDKIKFYNCPQVGRVRSFTLRIKQHASSAKTVSYSTIEFYTDKGSTAVSGTKTLQWSGGAAHVMSTGVGDFDIVQFTAFSDTANTVQIYGSVIGQNFS